MLSSFIVSEYGIQVDTLKVKAIINFLFLYSLSQLQSLQGKEKLL